MREADFLTGGDISALALLEERGAVYRSGGVAGDAIEIMVERGCNCFRLRLFVNPTGRNVVVNDLEYTASLARRIKAAGARFLLNFHFSDTWADPGRQTKPAAWEGLDFEGLVHAVRTHVYDSVTACAPDLIQIGNEITPGMLWPDGKLYGDGLPEGEWERFTTLLKAGVAGANAAAKDAEIALHIDRGGDAGATKWFFDKMAEHEVPYDVIALSYYPWWHGPIENLSANLRKTGETYGKDVLVVETAYPYRPHDIGGRENAAEWMRWPRTVEGQADYLNELIETVRSAAHGRGVLWWYPESVLVDGLHIWNGGSTALFGDDGEALPALEAFG